MTRLNHAQFTWLRNSLSDQIREHLDSAERLQKTLSVMPMYAPSLRLAELHTEAAGIFAEALARLGKEGVQA